MPARSNPSLAGEGGAAGARGSARGAGDRGRGMGRKNEVTERSAAGGASVPAPRPRFTRAPPTRTKLRGRGRGGATVVGGAGAGACHRSCKTPAAWRGTPPAHCGHRGGGLSVGSRSARRVGIHQELQGVGLPGKAGVGVPEDGGRAAAAAALHWLAISTHRAIFSEGRGAGVSSGRDCATQAKASGSWRSARASHTV
jgi:hypothetical protein